MKTHRVLSARDPSRVPQAFPSSPRPSAPRPPAASPVSPRRFPGNNGPKTRKSLKYHHEWLRKSKSDQGHSDISYLAPL
jgi:hypothetical protein